MTQNLLIETLEISLYNKKQTGLKEIAFLASLHGPQMQNHMRSNSQGLGSTILVMATKSFALHAKDGSGIGK